MPVPPSLLLASIVLLSGTLVWLRARRLHEKAEARDGLSRLRDQVRGRFPENLVEQVFTALSERHGAVPAHYVVRLGDDLLLDHGLAELDLEDAILVAADRAGARLPKVRDLETVHERVHTVEDMMVFLEPFFRPELVKE